MFKIFWNAGLNSSECFSDFWLALAEARLLASNLGQFVIIQDQTALNDFLQQKLIIITPETSDFEINAIWLETSKTTKVKRK